MTQSPDLHSDDLHRSHTLGGDREQLTSLYRTWADRYDDDVIAEGYVAPMITAQLATMVLPPDATDTVLDAGCGTGLVGQYLSAVRPQLNLIGVDLSTEMALKAESTQSYASVEGGVDLLTFADQTRSKYASVLCCGTLTNGHLGAEGLQALLTLTEPGGHVVFSVRRNHSLQEGFPDRVLDEQRQGTVDVISSLENAPYIDEEGADYWTLRKAPAS